MADWKFDGNYSMKKMFHFSKNCFLGHSPDVIAQLRKWGLCSKSTLAGHSQAITLLMGSFHVVLQGVFPITSDFADFALVELSFIMYTFFMTIPVGFTRKSLSAEWASKVLYLLVDGINMGCQGLRGGRPKVTYLAGKIQDLEVNAVDVNTAAGRRPTQGLERVQAFGGLAVPHLPTSLLLRFTFLFNASLDFFQWRT